MHGKRRLIGLLALLLALTSAGAQVVEDDFLLPDQAFQISAQADGPDAVRVLWDIADGYYLYRSKLRFRSETSGIAAGTPKTPPAETKQDEFFGEVEIYRGRLEVRLPLERSPGAGDRLTLEATSQGCADAGFCYPPHRQRLVLALPMLAAAAAEPKPRTVQAPAESGAQPPLDAVDGLGRSLGLGALDEDFLRPEEAFQFTAEAVAPDRLQLAWDIAEGTYLYQEKIAVALEEAETVALGDFELPEAEIKPNTVRPDGTVGDIAVYHHRIELPLPLLRGSAEATSVTLVARYQGCAERGICYPPMTQRVRLNLPATSAVTDLAAASTTEGDAGSPEPRSTALDPPPVSETDRIAATLAGGNLSAVIAIFFGFGLLLAFTPCIFPMIPILSGIIAGQGASITARKAFLLSLVFVLAMALTYSIAGVLAGVFGSNLQAAFQDPWVLGLFALVFVGLALSMFGFYDLQLPSALQSKLAHISSRQQGGTLAGVAIMGLLSALIVGPCVAPPLAGALLYIGQSGDWLRGGVSLLALGLGMGAPLVAIGTSEGKLLPRAGPWMDAVKAVFGVALLAVAILLMERILPPAAAMALWGLLMICSAVYLGALQALPAEASGWRKLWQGLGLVLLAYGVLMLIGAAAGGRDTVQPLRGLALGGGAPERHAAFKRIKTVADLDRELAAARAAGRPAILDFYADWCVFCKEMERYTFSDPAVIAEMDRFALLQADVTANDERDQALMQGRFGIPGPPALLFFDTGGEELRDYRVIGFKPAADFAEHLMRAAP